jgi:trehalose 6-phosphate phosphatase
VRLARLAEIFGRVAVVSGRSVGYLRRHLAGSGSTELVGLYGMERALRGQSETIEAPEATRWRRALAAAADEIESAAPPGLAVERKGLAVTIHYRGDPSTAARAESLVSAQAALRGLVAHPGKMSVELRPPITTDKGTVVADLAAGLHAVCFVGDDVGDLPAFAELSRLKAAGTATVAVAAAGPEAPWALTAAADLVVDGPEGVAGLLDDLADLATR